MVWEVSPSKNAINSHRSSRVKVMPRARLSEGIPVEALRHGDQSLPHLFLIRRSGVRVTRARLYGMQDARYGIRDA